MNVLPPDRVRRSAEIRLQAPPEDVFPLFCPVREVEWVDGWDPKAVYTTSGLVEADCVFVTADGGADAVWMVTRHEPERFALELIKVVPGVTVTKIEIALAAAAEGGTRVAVAYTPTALSEKGRTAVAEFTDEYFAERMAGWQRQLDHYLGIGSAPDRGGPRYE